VSDVIPRSGTAPPPLNRVTCVIVSWDTAELTARCVAALTQDGFPAERIVVVDNGSDPSDYARLRSTLSGSVLVRQDENVGFARAANLGARQLAGAAYLFVDNDAFVHRRASVPAMVRNLEQPEVGIVVPRMLNENLTTQRTVHSLPTPAVAFVRATGLSRLVPDRWQPAWGTRWSHDSRREIRAAAGPVLLIRDRLWHSLGGFGEYTGHFAIELDLFLRSRRQGWKTWFEPEAEFVHLGGASTNERLTVEERARVVGRSERQVITRTLPRPSAALSELFIVTENLVRLPVRYAMGDHLEAARLRGRLEGHLGLRRGKRTGRASAGAFEDQL
jgi:N-acetylglucosaminyl-diphospho-decaprenol L-rhamnosyltransferase